MTSETQGWLNENVLVGFTEKRGNAWHWRQGTDNHYPAEIPVEDVRRRLFDWDPVKVETHYRADGFHSHFTPSGEYVYLNNKTGRKLCATTETHKVHGYSEWLIQNVENVLDDYVQIGSAGLLKGGNLAWVQIELPENRQASGVEFRPTILATTSIDGSLATTYKAVNTIVVCDNTLAAGLAEDSVAHKVRHTVNSKFKVLEARERIGIVLEKQAEIFSEQVSGLVHREVTAKQFASFLEAVNPIPSDPGRGRTLAEKKRSKLLDMWAADPRVSIWQNTVWGVMQLMNTYETHERKFKGDRAESTLMGTVTGKAFEKDAASRAQIERILASA